jgi:hypothetical protein
MSHVNCADILIGRKEMGKVLDNLSGETSRDGLPDSRVSFQNGKHGFCQGIPVTHVKGDFSGNFFEPCLRGVLGHFLAKVVFRDDHSRRCQQDQESEIYQDFGPDADGTKNHVGSPFSTSARRRVRRFTGVSIPLWSGDGVYPLEAGER